MPLAKSARGSATNMNWVAPPGDVFERTLSLPTESATSQLVLSSNVRASLAQSNGCPQPQVAHQNGCKELLKPTHHRHRWLPEPQILQDIRCYWTWLEIGFDGSLQVKGHVEMSSFTIRIYIYIHVYYIVYIYVLVKSTVRCLLCSLLFTFQKLDICNVHRANSTGTCVLSLHL